VQFLQSSTWTVALVDDWALLVLTEEKVKLSSLSILQNIWERREIIIVIYRNPAFNKIYIII